MSLIPYFHRDMDPFTTHWPSSYMDLHPWAPPRLNNFASFCRWPDLAELQRAVSETVNSNISKDGFAVSLDVQQFAPNEITVKTVDNSVVVHAKHEERPDEHGYISRHLIRRYELPAGYDMEQVVTQLSSDGVLTIKAPPPAKSLEDSNERVLPIQQTGPARLSIGNKESAKPIENAEKKKD